MRLFALGLLLVGGVWGQTWGQAKSCSVQAVPVLRAWEDYFGAVPGSIILGSVNHQSPKYSGCFLRVDIGYFVAAPNGSLLRGTLFEYLLQIFPDGHWEYVATWNDDAASAFACYTGNGDDALRVDCSASYAVILDRMAN